MNRKTSKFVTVGAGLLSLAFLLKRKPKAAFYSAAIAGLAVLLKRPKFMLQGKSVVITGGSRGLGYAMAKAFLREGASVTILARNHEELMQATAQLTGELHSSFTEPPHALVCDITEPTQLADAINLVKQLRGSIDVFVNNAGSMLVGPFETMSREDFEAQMNLHLYANIHATQCLLPIFKEQEGGRIVNISSIGGKRAVPHMAPYTASKFALAGFSQAIQSELRRFNIFVTTVYPGIMRTGSSIQAVFKGDHEKEYGWFSAFSLLPGVTSSPDTVAERVVLAVIEGESEVIVSPTARFTVALQENFTEFMADATAFVNRFLPRGQSHRRKTGAAIQKGMEDSLVGKAIDGPLRKAQEKYNEKESFDPNYNLNLKH